MALPDDREFKQKLSEKLIYHSLLRMLVFDRLFRFGFVAVLGTFLFLAIYLPKIWRTTPKGFEPESKISLLDMTQNWSLKRSARKAQAQGAYRQAFYAWQAAVAQDPGDTAALRGSLTDFIQIAAPAEDQTATAVGQSFWLLRVSHTNEIDADLVSQLFEQIRREDMIVNVFGDIPERLPTKAKARLLKALFIEGRTEEFARQLEANRGAVSDSNLALCELAFKAGWQSGYKAVEAREELRQAMREGDNKSFATRLYMITCAQRQDLAGYGECLTKLTNLKEARPADHTRYWRLLSSNGRKNEAVRLAQAFTGSPGSVAEMLSLAEVYYNLQLREQARGVLRTFAGKFGYAPAVWVSYGSLLEELKDWEEMRELALQMRQQRSYREALGGLSYFFEGRADLGLGRTASAKSAFQKAAESDYRNPEMGLLVARKLMKAGTLDGARKILQRIQPTISSRLEYWETAFDCALQLKDGDWVLNAAEQAYQHSPRDVEKANRYAAALIANRIRPGEAVKLTSRILNSYPGSTGAMINHALALLMNARHVEAKARLERIFPAELKPMELSAYYLAVFEAHWLDKEYSRAWADSDRINRSTLFPAQEKWLAERLKEMPARMTGNY